MQTSTSRAWLIVFALLGLGASGTSAYVHYRLVADPTYTSFCNVSETVNCESVYQSVYGAIGGVPVAVIGALFFALAALLAWSLPSRPVPAAAPATGKTARSAQLPVETGSATGAYLFVLSTAALAAILYFAYVSFFVLKLVCVLCVATYAAVVGLFVISGTIGPARLSSLPRDAARDLRRLATSPVALTIALLYLAGAASAVAFFPRDRGEAAAAEPQASSQTAPATLPPSDPARQSFEAWLAAQPRVPLVIPADGAKVLVVKFNDYQCPPCRQTYNEYTPIIQRYQTEQPGQVKYVTKDFPLEAECNTGGVHAAGCEAAAAVRMARAKNRGDELERWIFDNQPAMTPELVRRGAREIGGIADFDAQYPKVLEQVKADVALGRQLGVTSTPTFFINGVKIVGGLRPQFFDVAIAAELARANGR